MTDASKTIDIPRASQFAADALLLPALAEKIANVTTDFCALNVRANMWNHVINHLDNWDVQEAGHEILSRKMPEDAGGPSETVSVIMALQPGQDDDTVNANLFLFRPMDGCRSIGASILITRAEFKSHEAAYKVMRFWHKTLCW